MWDKTPFLPIYKSNKTFLIPPMWDKEFSSKTNKNFLSIISNNVTIAKLANLAPLIGIIQGTYYNHLLIKLSIRNFGIPNF